MSDFLLDLAQNRSARKVIQSLGLPIPMPPKLKRAAGPWTAEPLRGAAFIIGGAGNAFARTGETLEAAGADVDPGASTKVRGLVFDATGVKTPEGLSRVYDFFHDNLTRLEPCGRLLIIGPLPDKLGPAAAAAAMALDGFTRTVAKEIGKRGATANLIQLQKGAEDRLDGPLRFLLAERSAYVSGQPLRVTKAVKGTPPQAWISPLKDKTALVTGAARGIGAETARLLAAAGAHVVCLDRPEDHALVEAIAAPLNGSSLLVDLSDPAAPQSIVEQLTATRGSVDIVVHNAGITRDKTLKKMSREYWDQVIAVNLSAVTRTTDALAEGLLQDDGRVICLSSVSGIAGNLGQSNYAASKAGLIGYVRAMAAPLAKRGITINAVAPGFIETRMTETIPTMIREVGRRLNALSQGGRPQDVAETVLFLASPDALGVNGSVVRVCGLSLIGA